MRRPTKVTTAHATRQVARGWVIVGCVVGSWIVFGLLIWVLWNVFSSLLA